jgi:uncharacterized membrane protein
MPRDPFQRHLIVVLFGLGLICLVLLLPDLSPHVSGQNGPVEAYRGRIEQISAPATDPGSDLPPVPMATVEILDGPRAGQHIDAYLTGPSGSQDTSTYAPGQEVVVTFTKTPDGSQDYIEVSDKWRLPGLAWLAVISAIAVVVIGGWQGVRALVALGLTAVIILKILLPLMIAGVPPVPLAVLTASGVTVVTILMTEGWRRSSIAAILGTTGALAITGLLAAITTSLLGFTYTAGSDLAFLATAGGGGLDLRGILLAAIILGSVGVLDDVTVTQAVLVDEMAATGRLRGPALVLSAMKIGRSHIGATVNTLFLAYVGVGLPLLVLLMVSAQPSAAVLNDETIATEIVRTLIGSLGIVMAIPLTTFIAVPLVDEATETGASRSGRHSPRRRVIAVATIVVVLLVATSVSSLLSPPRPPLSGDNLDPAALGLDPGASPTVSPDAGSSPLSSGDQLGAGPGDSDAPDESAATDGDLTLVDPGQAVPITLDGVAVGTVAVSTPKLTAGDTVSTATVSVRVGYKAKAPFPLATGSWEVLLEDGTEIPMLPTNDLQALEATLQPGQTLDVPLSAQLPDSAVNAFVVYVDKASDTLLFAVAIGS